MLRIPTALAAFALTTAALGSAASASNKTEASAPRVGAAGVTIVLPNGWHSWVPTGPPGHIVDPLTRIVAISAPFHFAASGCQIAGYSFPSNAVALVIVEWQGRANPGANFAPRPRRFTAKTLPLQPPPAIECFNGPGGSVQFADHGRTFGAYILLGLRAPARLADRARTVLETLRVQPHRHATRRDGTSGTPDPHNHAERACRCGAPPRKPSRRSSPRMPAARDPARLRAEA